MSKISKSSYFYEINTYKRDDKDKWIKDIIIEIFNDNKGRYGYPRITLELNINHKKVQRIMNMLNLKAISPPAKYKSYRGEIGRTCDNALLDKETGIRHFETTTVNQKWTTDITNIRHA